MKTRLFLSVLAFLLAGGILAVSLLSAPQVSSNGDKPTTERKLYFNRPLLPDHALYPVLMAVDRIQLETASSQERIFMQVEYAHRRLEYAEELLDLHKQELALTTLTKAEQYLHHAVNESAQVEGGESLRPRLAKAIEYHNKKMRELAPQFTDAQRAIMDKVMEENTVILGQLQTTPTASHSFP